jgi:protoporphyrinogen oxidase
MKVLILGAGPAGLTAAYLLAKQGVQVEILEADPQLVGGISRTVHYKGYHFDIGGHRFFSKSQEIEDLWTEILGHDLLDRPRSSKIFYKGKFYSYPLKAFEALFQLGIFESLLCVLSYARRKLSPIKNVKSFEDWVTNQFGQRLFQIFFKTYTEKVWGMSCKDISADWATQRIKGLNLSKAVVNALPGSKFFSRILRSNPSSIKTLIETFRYPRKGPGMMWERAAEKSVQMGAQLIMGQRVVQIKKSAHGKWSVISANSAGLQRVSTGDYLISSLSLKDLGQCLSPEVSWKNLTQELKYRDFLTVGLILKEKNLFSDNWIYIHDPSVLVGRIQNFKSWSPEMIPDLQTTCYGLEYFCFEGDGLWNQPDEGLIELAKNEIVKLGLARREDIIDGVVIRQSKAYPVYDEDYAKRLQEIKQKIAEDCPGLIQVGRNGLHRYNNQDHAMMTAILATKNILAGETLFDLWQVNEDAEYHEIKTGSTGLRMIPRALPGKEAASAQT